MKVTLFRREFGIGKEIKSFPVNGFVSDIVEKEDCVKEQVLLSKIPDGFLPCDPKYILLSVATSKNGSTGQRGLSIFKNWAKYFDAYFLLLQDEYPCDGMCEGCTHSPCDMDRSIFG